VVCGYLGVVISAPFELFVYKAHFEVPLEPAGGRRELPWLLHRWLLPGGRGIKETLNSVTLTHMGIQTAPLL